MSWESFSDECSGCRPAMIDAQTGRALSPNSKPMVALLRCWGRTTLQQRQAWHRFTCQNSRAPLDLIFVKEMQDQREKEMREGPP